MKQPLLIAGFLVSLMSATASYAESPAVTGLLQEYRSAGAGPFQEASGKALWTREFTQTGEKRSCTQCHGTDLRKPGKHATTGKPIEPLAPSANPKSLTDRAKIKKWFGRNCKGTLGRACTAQEKGDVLVYLITQ